MEYQESFFEYLMYEKRFSSHTLVAYKNDLGQFVQYCTTMAGEFNVKEVGSKLMREWVINLMVEGISPRSVNRKVSGCKIVL